MIKGNHLVKRVFSNAEMPGREILFKEPKEGAYVRNQEWKLVRLYAESPWKLYKFNDDSAEMKNQADPHPEIVSQLDNLWQNWARQNHDVLEP